MDGSRQVWTKGSGSWFEPGLGVGRADLAMGEEAKELRLEESEAWTESTTISVEEREDRVGRRKLRADEKSSVLIDWKSWKG